MIYPEASSSAWVTIRQSPRDVEKLIVNPYHYIELGDSGLFKRQGPIKGFRIAPINPAKRLGASKRRKRR